MSGMRRASWALVGLGVTGAVIACGGGGSGQNGPAANMSTGGSSGTGTVLGAGTSGSSAGAAGACLNTVSDPLHCGSCSTVCAQGQICDQSTCKAPVTSCTAPQAACNGVCVDLTSTAHCGTCDKACATGQSCTAGACACPGTQSTCNGACVDTQSSVDNCGSCGKACGTGAVCTAGACACATGQSICSGQCVDLKQSADNCGKCGTACPSGQTCSGGACVSGAGADGCSGPALGITLKQVDVYQSVKVAVMSSGTAVTPDMRTSDVVTGRPTMFRLSVNVDSGFAARQLSARVTVNNGTTATQYFTKLSVSKSSVETDPKTTFQIYLPPDQITVDTRYSAELVECGTGTGQAGSARFPTTGDTELGARHTGGVKITLIPLQANNKVPDTSDTGIAAYREQMLAMYPIDSITFSVGTPLSISYPIDWETALDQMRAKRKTDNVASDVYYYGLLKPVDTFKAFCGNGCTAGIGYVADTNTPGYRVAMGIAYSDQLSGETMAHEVGHNHGRNHAPCVPPGSSIDGVDPDYPFPDGRTGVIGYDSRTKALLADTGTDLMGYCDNVWLSAYTYNGLADRVAAVNGVKSVYVDPAALQTWRVLLIGGSKGARWGVPITQPSLPEGAPVTARVVDAAGNLVEEITVYRTEITDTGAASVMVPEPKNGWNGIDVGGSGVIVFAKP
ncbi:MAG: zinc-dependent metalloprotease family protein [Polyangiaceae bacterium]